LPIAGLTAQMVINGTKGLGHPDVAGQSILIQGTGGVATSGLLIAKVSDSRVIITSSSHDKPANAKDLDTNVCINYKSTPNWADQVLRATNDQGADIIFENGGALTLRQSFECVALED
jgi:NADPH:quinone reductase-like Zn-dependent oxidoreductase